MDMPNRKADQGPRGSSRLVLLVEDDDVQREALNGTLSEAGYVVAACRNAGQALARFIHWQPEVAVIDLRMPGMDGLELTARLREVDPTLGVLILTAAPEIPSAVQAMKMGATDFLVKPQTPQQLVEAVEASAARRASERLKEIQRMVDDARVRSLEDTNTHLNEFAARAAHDLRSPLRASYLWIEFAREALRSQDSAQADEYLQSALKCLSSGRSMVDGLLSLSKASILPLRPTDIEIGPVIQSSVEVCRLEFQPREFEVQVQVDGRFRADMVLVGVAVCNLIHNAFKYSSVKDTPRIDIVARSIPMQGYEVSVKDNGIGIPERLLDKLFQPFERLNHHPGLSGEGIGLSTVKRVVDRHKGSVQVRSVEGEGTMVSLLFPHNPEVVGTTAPTSGNEKSFA